MHVTMSVFLARSAGRGRRSVRVRSSGVLLVLLLSAAALVAEGTQTGTVAGQVLSAEGAPLLGVEVVASGPQTRRTALSDEAGRFRFPSLAVGRYSVTAQLLDLAAVPHLVEVYIDKTSEVRLELGTAPGESEPQLVAESESIEVIAEAPIIDRYDVRVGATLSRDFLDPLPVQRFYQSVALVMPGVAGGEDGNPNTSGALRSGNLFLIDGVDTTDPTTGLFGLNLAYEAVQAVDVTTAAAAPEYGRFSGAIVNVVTRSGANRFAGAARGLAVDSDLQADYGYAPDQVDHLADEITTATLPGADPDLTFALSLSGPLWRDRLFFAASYENAASARLRPIYKSGTWDEAGQLDTSAYKVTAVPSGHHTITAQYTADQVEFSAFRPFDRGPAENQIISGNRGLETSALNSRPGDTFALQREDQRGDFSRLQWSATFGQNVSLELSLAQQARRLERAPANSRGLTADAPHLAVTAFRLINDDIDNPEFDDLALFNGITDVGYEDRPRDQASVGVVTFASGAATDHEIKVGLDFQRTESERQFGYGGAPGLDRGSRRPVSGQLFVDFDRREPCVRGGACAPFDLATGAFRPYWLFNFLAQPPARTRERVVAAHAHDAIAWRRAVLSFGARYELLEGSGALDRTLVEADSIAPRLGVKYDPLGDGRVLLSLALGRYYEPFLQQYLDGFSRADVFSGYAFYSWNFFDPACKTTNPADLANPCWQYDNVYDSVLSQGAAPNPELERSYVDEVVLGFERQLTDALALRLHVIGRKWRELWDNVLTEGGSRRASSVRNLDLAERDYRAVQLLLQKRFAHNWQLLGSYTWSKAEGNLFQNDGLASFADFLDRSDTNLINRYGFAPYDRPHRLRLYTHNRVPLGRASLGFGNVLRYESGVPHDRVSIDNFGERYLRPRGAERLSDLWQWDLALLLDVRLGPSLELELKGEVFNVSNETDVLNAESVLQSGYFGLPRSLADLQQPRNYRLSLGLRF